MGMHQYRSMGSSSTGLYLSCNPNSVLSSFLCCSVGCFCIVAMWCIACALLLCTELLMGDWHRMAHHWLCETVYMAQANFKFIITFCICKDVYLRWRHISRKLDVLNLAQSWCVGVKLLTKMKKLRTVSPWRMCGSARTSMLHFWKKKVKVECCPCSRSAFLLLKGRILIVSMFVYSKMWIFEQLFYICTFNLFIWLHFTACHDNRCNM